MKTNFIKWRRFNIDTFPEHHLIKCIKNLRMFRRSIRGVHFKEIVLGIRDKDWTDYGLDYCLTIDYSLDSRVLSGLQATIWPIVYCLDYRL